MSRIQSGREVSEEHLKYLRRSLCRINHLLDFHRVLEEIFETQPELEREYLYQIHSAILYIAIVYREKEDMQAGYFAYFLSSYTAKRDMPGDLLQDIMLDYVERNNLYCRYNALKALYHFANAEYAVAAIKIQDDDTVFLHEKIITEGLLSFSGDHNQLIEKLWEQFPCFSVHTQLAVLNYIRFRSGDYKEQFYPVMTNTETDKELRLAAIRYFGKYYYEPALEPLLSFVWDKDPARWEFACVAISSLAVYEGEAVTSALQEALHSGNWHIRYAAAQSLDSHHAEYGELMDIVAGNDRYAREMMLYRLESRKLQKPGSAGKL